jgi:hypothetical protein
MVLSPKLEKRYKRLYISKEDLVIAAQFADFILKKGWHHEPWERRGAIYLHQSAFTISLIISYSRPFTRSIGLPDFPKRLLKYNETEQKLHDAIIQLRHRVYAHSGNVSYKVQAFSIDGFPTAILNAPSFKLSKSEVEMLQFMIERALKEIYIELKIIAGLI